MDDRLCVTSRDGCVPKMCTLGGCQCKTILIPGLRNILSSESLELTLKLTLSVAIMKYKKQHLRTF